MRFQKMVTESLKQPEENGRINNYHGTGLDIVPFNYDIVLGNKRSSVNCYVIVAKGRNSAHGEMDIAIHCIDGNGDEMNFKTLEDAKAFLDNPEVELDSNGREITLSLPRIDDSDELEEGFDDEDFNFYLDDTNEPVSPEAPMTIATPVNEEPHAYKGLENAVRDLITAKNSFIGQLNQFLVDLDAYEPNPQVAMVINNIINDNNNEIGQLQALLTNYSSKATSEIVQGIADTTKELSDICSDDLDGGDFADLQAFVQNVDMDKVRNF